MRHMIPLFFVCAFFLMILGGLFWWPVFAILGAMYVLYFGLAVIYAAKKTHNPLTIAQMCGYYWLLHISYGLGSLKEIFSRKNTGSVEH